MPAGSTPAAARPSDTERALLETTRELAEADRQKDRVLSRLGHEMRNPMNALANGLDVLACASDPTERAELFDMLRRQTTQLAALIDDLVDVARVQSGQLRVELVARPLAPFVREVIAERKLETTRLGIRLEAVADPASEIRVAFDPARLRQVLHNLLGNAIKAVSGTPRPGRIRIELGALGAPDGRVAIRVRDNGRGIAAEHLERIFGPFERIGAGVGDAGLGLGLSIARELVARHAGELQVESEGEGRGATFTIELPTCAARSVGAPSDRANDPDRDDAEAGGDAITRAPRRILLIDDDADSLDVLRRVLERFGHEAHRASDGPTGIALALELRPDIVICDIGMPGMNGFEVARTLRRCLPAASTRLIGLTGYADDATARAALDAGFDQHVAKPISGKRLKALVQVMPKAA